MCAVAIAGAHGGLGGVRAHAFVSVDLVRRPLRFAVPRDTPTGHPERSSGPRRRGVSLSSRAQSPPPQVHTARHAALVRRVHSTRRGRPYPRDVCSSSVSLHTRGISCSCVTRFDQMTPQDAGVLGCLACETLGTGQRYVCDGVSSLRAMAEVIYKLLGNGAVVLAPCQGI